jgi:hypothetical protein
MTENSKLKHMAMTIGAISKGDDRIALKVAKARMTAKKKLAAISRDAAHPGFDTRGFRWRHSLYAQSRQDHAASLHRKHN